jgi:hypothetical protein
MGVDASFVVGMSGYAEKFEHGFSGLVQITTDGARLQPCH